MTENTYTNLAQSLLDHSEELSLYLLRRLRMIANRVVRRPSERVDLRGEIAVSLARVETFLRQAEDWVDEELPRSYLRGIQSGNTSARQASAVLATGVLTRPRFIPRVPPASIAPKAAKILSAYPEHHTMYSVFQQAAYNEFAQMQLPIVRQQADRIRRIVIEASEAAYRDADTFTRRKMQQELLNRFSDEGITGIRYSNGRMMNIDSYSEMVARTQTGNASRQANMLRLQQYGIDLVQISVHYPCSPMCEPYQGRVFSISGDSSEYMALDDAIDGGLYHPNCYDDKTEVYTRNGWRLFRDVQEDDMIMSLNPNTHKPEWMPHAGLIKYHRNGEMIEMKDRSFSLCVTP